MLNNPRPKFLIIINKCQSEIDLSAPDNFVALNGNFLYQLCQFSPLTARALGFCMLRKIFAFMQQMAPGKSQHHQA
ncbi:hypothetical protein TRIP_B350058 [uncultured Desulfatiglans sp.]|uniref:Uncharacterized protein n=1 Tax=Uncultured Desulfatiglans sp. TaxID=1748965 RepID=A0A653AAC2_UNCDX|nr:hypothetical protein TRIP_B350058 [uncultured Desulfatiglans sp.]